MIGFETIGNATLTCFDDIPVLSTDPWIEGTPYFGSWGHPIEIPDGQIQNIRRSKYIWLSHGHPDHINGASFKFFRNKFENPMSLLRCNYYPPRRSSLSNKDYGIAPHTDYGCLTILLTDNNPGLEIKNPSNNWELVNPEEGELIVNFGDMLEFWSKKKIKATPHRVYGNNKERFSIPFFFNPQYDTVISKKDKIIAGVYLSKKYDTTYLHKKK